MINGAVSLQTVPRRWRVKLLVGLVGLVGLVAPDSLPKAHRMGAQFISFPSHHRSRLACQHQPPPSLYPTLDPNPIRLQRRNNGWR